MIKHQIREYNIELDFSSEAIKISPILGTMIYKVFEEEVNKAKISQVIGDQLDDQSR